MSIYCLRKSDLVLVILSALLKIESIWYYISSLATLVHSSFTWSPNAFLHQSSSHIQPHKPTPPIRKTWMGKDQEIYQSMELPYLLNWWRRHGAAWVLISFQDLYHYVLLVDNFLFPRLFLSVTFGYQFLQELINVWILTGLKGITIDPLIFIDNQLYFFGHIYYWLSLLYIID